MERTDGPAGAQPGEERGHPASPSAGVEEPEALTAPQLRAVASLLRGAKQAAAARTAGVTDRTLRNWLRRPAFQAALRDGRSELLGETTTLLHAGSREAVATLRKVLKDPQARPTDRVAAARALLDLGLRAAEALDHSQRLTDLETQLQEKLSPNPAPPPPITRTPEP